MPIDFTAEFKRLDKSVPRHAQTKPEILRNLEGLKAVRAHAKVAEDFQTLDLMIQSELMRLRAGVPQKYKDVVMVSPRAVNPDAYQRYNTDHDWMLEHENDENFYRYSRYAFWRIGRKKGNTKTRIKRGSGGAGLAQTPVMPLVEYDITTEGRLKVYRVIILHESEFEDSYDPRTDPLDSALKKLSDKEWENIRRSMNNAMLSVSNAAEKIRRQSVNAVMPEVMRQREETLGRAAPYFRAVREYFYGEKIEPYPNDTPLVGSGDYVKKK